METDKIIDPVGSHSTGITTDPNRLTEVKQQISSLNPQYMRAFWLGTLLVIVPLLASIGIVYWWETHCRDWPFYAVVISAIAMLAGFVFVAKSGSINKRLGKCEADLRFLLDLDVALKMAEQLPRYVQKEPKTTIRENQGTPTAKETEKAPDYMFPRQQAQRQILETILSRHAK